MGRSPETARGVRMGKRGAGRQGGGARERLARWGGGTGKKVVREETGSCFCVLT